MATSTTRVGLRKPGEADNVIVLTDINDNLDDIDNHLGFYVCTSATRPTGTDRFTGRTILETDTGNRYYWTGTDWFLMNKLFKRKTAIESVSSTTLQDDNHIFFTLDPGTWLIDFYGHVNGHATNDINVAWNFSGSSTLTSRSVMGGAGSSGDSANASEFKGEAVSITATVGYAIDTTDGTFIMEKIIVIATTSGVLQMQWARAANVTPGTPTDLTVGTRATAERVA